MGWLLLAPWWSEAQEEDSAPPPALTGREFEAFQVIAERNIFNPNRSRRAERQSANERPSEERREPSTETLALIGTMSYEKGRFAIFDGSSSDYRVLLRPDQTIAGLRVASVDVHRVALERDGKRIELAVGMHMKRQEQGEWSVAGADESWRGSDRGGSRSSGGSRDSSGDSRSSRDGRDGRDSRDSRSSGDSSRSRAEGSSFGESPARADGADAEPSAEESEILRRLMQQREQETSDEK